MDWIESVYRRLAEVALLAPYTLHICPALYPVLYPLLYPALNLP